MRATSGAQAELLLQNLVLLPEETQLAGQLTLVLHTLDVDAGGCWTHTHRHTHSQGQVGLTLVLRPKKGLNICPGDTQMARNVQSRAPESDSVDPQFGAQTHVVLQSFEEMLKGTVRMLSEFILYMSVCVYLGLGPSQPVSSRAAL